jgi:hypothetical protein
VVQQMGHKPELELAEWRVKRVKRVKSV